MEGIEAVTSYYPIPNNHVFQNVLNWTSHQLNPDFFFRSRAFNTFGTLGLLVLFMLLNPATNFRTAAAFAIMIGTAYLPFYFSITGRGYSFLLILAGIGFVSTYYILRAENVFKRLHYLILTCSSIAGLYTVPTYLYTFATYIAILFAAALIQKRYTLIITSAGVCCVVGLTTFLLYSPIVVVSGVKALFGNTYITPQGTSEVLTGLVNYFMTLESSIVGQDRIGFVISILVLLLIAVFIFTDVLSQKKKLLCIMALVGMLAPYAFFLLQGVLPPGRTVAYKAFYFFLLVAIIADAIISSQTRHRKAAVVLFAVSLSLHATYEISISYRDMERLQPEEEKRQYIWNSVTQESPASMYITDPFYQLFFLRYAKVSGREISFHSDFKTGEAYDVLILTPGMTLPQNVLFSFSSTPFSTSALNSFIPASISVMLIFENMLETNVRNLFPIECQKNKTLCGLPPTNLEPYTTSALPFNIGSNKQL